MTGLKYKRGGGVVPVDMLAADGGQTIAEAHQSIAEWSAAGIVRLVLGPEGETTRIRVTRYLTVLNKGGKGGCHVLYLAQPAPAKKVKQEK